jgi:Spy/CpxP family protein refolding chaperone
MFKRNSTIGAAFLALALVVGLAAMSTASSGPDEDRQGGGLGMKAGCGGPMMGGHGKIMEAALKLTAAQREQIKDDRVARAKRMIQMRAETQTLKLDLHEAEREEKPDLAKVESIANQLGQLHAKMIVERAKGRAYFLSILTPEQKKMITEKRFEEPCEDGTCGKHEEGE